MSKNEILSAIIHDALHLISVVNDFGLDISFNEKRLSVQFVN
jgi:hypothetical protein